MTTRLRKLFSKNSDSKKGASQELPNSANERDEDFSGANYRRLSRSHSGRIKEISKMRLAIAQDTYVPPEDVAHSAPVISMRKNEMSLTGRELTMQETARLSRSLQFNLNQHPIKDSPTTGTIDHEHPDYEFSIDENEVF